MGVVKIGGGVIMQANSFDVNSIPKYAIAEGLPAKVFNHRSIKHYNSLKKEKNLIRMNYHVC